MDNSFDPRALHQAAHIKGAHFLCTGDLREMSSPVPHMLPTREHLITHLTKLGVGLSKPIVCYDGQMGIWATRAAYVLSAWGAPDVRILDGGLKFWQAEGLPVESGDVAPSNDTNHNFAAQPSGVTSFENV